MANRNSSSSEQPEYRGRFATYRVAALRFVGNYKASKGVSPTVALRKGDARYAAWAEFLRFEFGDVPWEFKDCDREMLDSVTVPCEWPETFRSTLNVVKMEAA